MDGKAHQKVSQQVVGTYKRRTPRSQEHDRKAREYLPGGDTRSTLFFGPYPTYMRRGRGCRLYDWDGNEYLDFLGNYTSLIHGHAHPALIEAARVQLEAGTIFGAPSEIQYLHARHLCQRIPSLQSVRYCNSGSEATQFAFRCARAFTGKNSILKMDGGYHGTTDAAEVNLFPDLKSEGLPNKHVETGVPPSAMEDVLVAPFNDLAAIESLMASNLDRLAAVVVEPIMGAAGLVNPGPGFLEGLRELADRFGVLLIFDEVITFRLSRGGFQALSGVTPDLTALGKIIGGGLPVGAFGGRREVMGVFNPDNPSHVNHGGTFNGNNVTMGAGLAALELYDQAAVDRLNALGDRLREGFYQAAAEAGVAISLSGRGSILNLHWGSSAPVNARESFLGRIGSGDLLRLLHLEMLNQGVHSAPRGMFILSTPMTETEVDQAAGAFGRSLAVLRPYLEEDLPQLLLK